MDLAVARSAGRRAIWLGVTAMLVAATAGCGHGEQTAGPTATAEIPIATITARSAKAAVARKAFEALTPGEPGCSVAVGEDGEVVWAEGFGLANLETGQPITPDTVFDIGSTSKQFTATAVLLLVQEGKLDLDAPLSRYLPQLPSWAERVTLRQMMHMQSGIPDFEYLFMDRGHKHTDPLTIEDAMALLAEVRELDFEPGAEWSYSNSNYFLFSQVVQSVTGQTLTAYLANEVFEPLGLNAVMDRQARIPEKAVSYSQEGDQWVIADQSADSPWEPVGQGAIQTTPSELVRWAAQYWDPTIGGAELLAARTEGAVDTILPGWRYGAGITIGTRSDGGPVLTHSGGFAGFLTELLILPDERLAAAVTCNRGGASRDTTALAAKAIAAWRGSEIGTVPVGG
jgi:CubicO group peptidase (beta-lactamase class C family)